MTALSADANIQSKVGMDPKAFKIADNVKIYKGAIVCVDPSTGYVKTGATTAGFSVVGIADEQCDNTLTGHTAGGKTIRVVAGRAFLLTASGMAQTSVGLPAYLVDDQTVGLAPQTNGIYVGEIVEYVSATQVWVFIPPPNNQVLGVTVAPSVSGGYRIARGQASTASASDTIVTGLSTLIGVLVTMNDDPAAGFMWVSGSIGDQAGTPAAGSFLLKSWKTTAANDDTPIAATSFTKKVNWLAIGL